MKNLLRAWQTPVAFLLLIVGGLLDVEGRELLSDGVIFLIALYAFSATTSQFTSGLKPQRTMSAYATAAAVGLCVLFAIDPSRDIGYYEVQQLGTLVIVAYFTASARVADVIRCVKLALVALSGLAVWGLLQEKNAHLFARGPFADGNMFGGVMLCAACVAAGLFADEYSAGKQRVAAMWGCLTVLFIAALTESHSRGAFAAGVVTIVVVAFSTRDRLGLSWKKLAVGAVALVVVGFAATYVKTQGDLGQHNGLGASFNSRSAIIESTIHMIEDRPVLGSGWGTWMMTYPRYRLAEDSESAGFRAHNDYLEAWSTGGLIGGLEMLALPLLLLFVIKNGRQPGKLSASLPLFIGLVSGAGVLVVQAGCNFIFHQIGVCALVGLLIGATYALTARTGTSTAVAPARPWKIVVATVALLLSAYLSIVTYLGAMPAYIIANPRGIEGLTFGGLMKPDRLELLSKLDFISPVPDFGAGQLYMVAGVLEKHNPSHRRELLDTALKYFDRSEKRDPLDPINPFRKATIYGIYPEISVDQRYALATSEFEKALAANPFHYDSLQAYSLLLAKFGHKDIALKRIDETYHRAPARWKPAIVKLRTAVATGTFSQTGGGEK